MFRPVVAWAALIALAAGLAGAARADGPSARDDWRAELLVQGQPDQPVDYPCNRDLDCLSSSRSFYGGALRAGYARPEVWSGTLTASFGHASDLEDRPVGGFGVASLRADVQFELGRGPTRFGAALRASEVIAVGWSDDATAVRSDFPGVALLLGRTDLWGEVGIPTLPTQADPRLFYAQVGWVTDRLSLEAGFASFGSLGFQHGELDRAGRSIGLWAAARYRISGPWELTGQVAVTYPCIMAVGIGYHASGREPPTELSAGR